MLKTLEISGIEKSCSAKNSSLDRVRIFHNVYVAGCVKICQFYIVLPYLWGFSNMLPGKPRKQRDYFDLQK
jgi:hypothetical protein